MGLPRYGGQGGRGGNVYLVAKENETLKRMSDRLKSRKLAGMPGGNSNSNQILGTIGEDLTVPVPTGITVLDDHGCKLGLLKRVLNL